CISRASVDSYIFVDWNLGKRKSGRGGMENYNLPGDRKFYFAAWLDPAVSKRSGSITQLCHSRVADCCERGTNHSRRTTPHLPAVAYRLRNSRFALSISPMGAGSLRFGPGASSDVARR